MDSPISVRLPAGTRKRIDQLAKEKLLKPTDLVRMAIGEFLTKEETAEPVGAPGVLEEVEA